MTITRRELEKLKDDFDPDAREYFLNMTPEEQSSVMFSMSASNSNRLAKVEKWQIDFERDARLYREKRERRENQDDDNMLSTTQKILKAISDAEAKKFNWGVWARDRVLPQLVTTSLFAFIVLLGLFLSGRLP